ncbi:hypothetical protein [Raoultibacter phocaeensis]|uniref:hypothetical protein n=1 Tax=Raoultibacter phocaeensis TaxID=2479841 RepID=UPI0011193D27|nr:hypothetical protein [Raoultibacter phocaeensis]
MMKSAEELERLFGVRAEDIEKLAAPWENGGTSGKPTGEITVGRPLKFGSQLRLVGFKETESKIDAIDRRAQNLGMKRSDYLRWVVDRDLAQASHQ